MLRKLDLSHNRSRWWAGLPPKQVVGPPALLTVAIIIPAYNEAASIRDTVESLLRQTIPVDEIFVIDDGSTDSTAEAVRECIRAHPRAPIRLIETKNGGKWRALNCGIDLATSSLIVTVDADTTLAPNAIARVLPYFRDPDIHAVSGYVKLRKVETFFEKGRNVEYLLNQQLIKSAQNHLQAVVVAAGCFTIFRGGTLKELGGFSSGSMAEDMETTFEIWASRRKVAYCQEAIAYVIDPPTFPKYTQQVDRWYRGFLQILRKHHYNLQRLGQPIATLVYFYLMSAIVGSVLAIITPVAVITWMLGVWHAPTWVHALSSTLFAIIILNQIVWVWVPVILKAKEFGEVAVVLRSIHAFYLLQYLNKLLFVRAVWQECVLGNRLTIWHKGH